MNDAGGDLQHRRERMDAFLDFVGADAHDPRRSQEALYKARTFGPPGREVKVSSAASTDPLLFSQQSILHCKVPADKV